MPPNPPIFLLPNFSFQLYRYNTPRVNHCIVKLLHRLTELDIGEAVDVKSGRTKTATSEPILFQVSTMVLFERILADREIARDRRFKELRGFTKAAVRHFLRALKTNSLLMVEALFWRTRRAHVALQSNYKEGSRHARNDDTTQNKSSRRDHGASAVTAADLEGEDEADLDIDALGAGSRRAKARKAKEKEAAAVSKRRRAKRWTDHEEALLATKFRELVEAGFEDVYEISQVLALEDLLSANDRKPDQVERRLKKLNFVNGRGRINRRKLASKAEDASGLTVNTNMLRKQMSKLLLDAQVFRDLESRKMDDTDLASAAGNDTDSVKAQRNRHALAVVERALERCASSRQKREELREAMAAMRVDDENEPSAQTKHTTTAAFAIVPLTGLEFRMLQQRNVLAIMKALRFREPSDAGGECYHRIPAALSARECGVRLELLRCTIENGINEARGMPKVKVIRTAKGRSISNDSEEDSDEEFGADELTSSSAPPSSSLISTPAQASSISLNMSSGSSMRLPTTGVALVNLRSEAGMMVCANKGGSLSADRFKAGPWELLGFRAVNSGSQFTIRTAHNTYVSVSDSGRLMVTESLAGASIGKRGIFQARYTPGEAQLLTLQCVGTGKYWTADEDGILSCTASSAKSNDARFFVLSASNDDPSRQRNDRGGRLVSEDDSDTDDSDSDDEFAKQFLAKRMNNMGDSDDDTNHSLSSAASRGGLEVQAPRNNATSSSVSASKALSSMMDDSDSEDD